LKLEKLFCDACMSGTNPNNAWFAEQLGVTTRTIRNYWKDRLERIHGPEKVYLHLHDAESGKESVELLTLEGCAKRLSISVTELRKRIRAQCRKSGPK
jgi:predicted transcriptional regulator